MEPAKQQRFRVAELYAGTARSVEPFREWDKAEIVLLADNNQLAADTYLANYPNSPYVVEDLTGITAKRVRKIAGGDIDILLGCPPCQGFSDNGKRHSRDRRNRHLTNFARLAVELQPAAIAIENVPLAAGSNAFRRFTRQLKAAGYKWTAGIVNAALFGSCQCRQRLIYVAIHESVGSEPVLPQPSHGGRRKYFNYNTRRLCGLSESENALLGVTPATFQVRDLLPYKQAKYGKERIPVVREVLQGLPPIGTKAADAIGHVAWAHGPQQLRRMRRIREGGQPKISRRYYSQSYGRLHSQGLAKTITTAFPNGGSGRFWHPIENRSLTLREAARIQGFPDTFAFQEPSSQAAFLVGNALDAALASVVFSVIRSCLS
jgi:DNA (cytosine-5)-methyltransferase 1